MPERRVVPSGRDFRPRTLRTAARSPSTHPDSPGSKSVSRSDRRRRRFPRRLLRGHRADRESRRSPRSRGVRPHSRSGGAIRTAHRPEARIRRRLDSPGVASHDAISPGSTGGTDRLSPPAPFGRASRETRDIGPIGPPTPGCRRSRAPSRGHGGRMMGLEDRDGHSHPARDPAGRRRPSKDLRRDSWRPAMLASQRMCAE
jgi:hypothetical protein